MHSILTDKLYEEFSELYPKTNKPSDNTHVHFDHQDGWFMILYDLSVDVMKISQKENVELPKVVRIKEKYGTLRYYVLNANEEILQRINQAENKSEETCEKCGKKGQKQSFGALMKTLFNEHASLM